MAARTALGSALKGIRAVRQVSRMVDVLPGSSSVCCPSASRIACFLPLDGARYFHTKKESDDLLRDSVKQAVVHGLRDALSKSKNDDNSVMKLSVIREGVTAGLKETLCHYNIFLDCDEADPRLRLMIQEAVEEALKSYGYQIPKKDISSGESGSESSAQGAGNWVPGFGLLGSAQSTDPSNEDFDPRHLAFMRYVEQCVSKSVDDGFEDALKRSQQQPDAGKSIDNDEEADQDWIFTDARFARQKRRFSIWEEKQAQKRREQHASYTKLMNERAARAEKARKEERMELIKEGLLGLQKAVGRVTESVDAGFNKSQQASDAQSELELLNSQTLLLALGVLEDMAKDLGYLMFKDAQETERLESEKLWVYVVLEKLGERLPFNPALYLKTIVQNVDEWKTLYPIVGCAFVLSRSHFTPMEWVDIAKISNDDWVDKWTKRLENANERSKGKSGKGTGQGDDSSEGSEE